MPVQAKEINRKILTVPFAMKWVHYSDFSSPLRLRVKSVREVPYIIIG